MSQHAFKQEPIFNLENINATPILKWAGGKTQLLPTLDQHFPEVLKKSEIETYIEPFVGGGAVFFNISNRYRINQAYLFDINPELIILYNSLKQDVDRVISELAIYEEKYLSADTEERKEFFYHTRNIYNEEVAIVHKAMHHTPFNAKRSAATIFLNRTCFNGLFRVNSKGGFNVPHGRYKNPTIVFEEKLRAAAAALQKATIKLADFQECLMYADRKTFIYYDPPYRPVNNTSNFTSYAKEKFGDEEQCRLAETIRTLDKRNVFQLMSNSDPTNYKEDPFFDELYKDFKIFRIKAKRMINSNASKRGKLREILVRNY